MNLSHRPFKASDAETIRTFPNSVEELFFILPDAAYPLETDRLLDAVRAGHDPTVGLYDSRVAGYADFAQVRENKFCAIGRLVVGAAHRRKGVGAHLVEVMVRTAIDKYAVRFVKVSCFSHNKGAYALFHKLGFRPADMGQRLGPDGDPLLLIHMHLLVRNWKNL